MYMCSRLIVNVSQTYWPLYLTESLQMTKVRSFNRLSVCHRDDTPSENRLLLNACPYPWNRWCFVALLWNIGSHNKVDHIIVH